MDYSAGLLWHELHLEHIGNAMLAVRPDLSTVPIAICIGTHTTARLESPLVRLQSRCVYGEVLGSLDCDCAFQLRAAMAAMAEEGAGILVYLDQEGRGAGMLAKAQGYAISQRDGVDSFDAYHRMGLPADQRQYDEACELLRTLTVTKVRLLTNNPNKVAALQEAGFSVERVPLWPDVPASATRYIESKIARGHLS